MQTPSDLTNANAPNSVKSGWHADLRLGFAYDGRRTVLSQKHFKGPLTVQKPFYPEQDTCHLYLLHPPGGIVSGDRLELSLHLAANTHVVATTPAANKFYRSNGAVAQLTQRFHLDDNAKLEYLPQESILFNASNTRLQTQIHLTGQARFISWDIICLGRPAGNQPFSQGHCRQRTEVYGDGLPLLTDRLQFAGDSESLSDAWGFNGRTTFGYLIASPVSTAILHALKSHMRFNAEQQLAVSLVKNLLICRYLGYHAEQAKLKFIQVWEHLRPQLMNKPACPPRIWRT